MQILNRYFELDLHGTTVRTEVMAGLTTFLTMAYIAFVNPQILSEAGMDRGAVFVATCLAAAIGSAIMGLYANYPIAQAPGMGLNAFFTYGVVLGLGYPWQTALGAVFVSGICFMALSVLPIREWVVNAFPRSLKLATSAGIGLFLAIIAMRNAGLVEGSEATLVTLGDVTAAPAVLAVVGLILIAALEARRVTGGPIIGILAVTAVGLALGVTPFRGVVDLPPSIAPTLFVLDIGAALDIALFGVIFAFLFTDLFDTAGTLIGVAHQADLLDADGRLPRVRKALVADSTATTLGALLGTSPVTSYIESAAGVKAGGRTGLTAVTVSALFLATLFLSPLADTIPAYATAAVLLFVTCLMARSLIDIDWSDVTEYAPAVVLAVTIPLSFSIADGIAAGFITYAAIKLLSGRAREAQPAVLILAAVFVARFVWLGA
ncbi:MAG: NCS2 family permease [Acidobacteria bacterium]|nr:NCS2 family permease [Acidobacteriota bacterium]